MGTPKRLVGDGGALGTLKELVGDMGGGSAPYPEDGSPVTHQPVARLLPRRPFGGLLGEYGGGGDWAVIPPCLPCSGRGGTSPELLGCQ